MNTRPSGSTRQRVAVETARANGLRGAKYFTQRHHLTLRDAKVAANTSDLRNLAAALAGAPRVTAIALSTAPDQTATSPTHTGRPATWRCRAAG